MIILNKQRKTTKTGIEQPQQTIEIIIKADVIKNTHIIIKYKSCLTGNDRFMCATVCTQIKRHA